MVPGAAATEVELTRKLKEFSFSETAYSLSPSWKCFASIFLSILF